MGKEAYIVSCLAAWRSSSLAMQSAPWKSFARRSVSEGVLLLGDWILWNARSNRELFSAWECPFSCDQHGWAQVIPEWFASDGTRSIPPWTTQFQPPPRTGLGSECTALPQSPESASQFSLSS